MAEEELLKVLIGEAAAVTTWRGSGGIWLPAKSQFCGEWGPQCWLVLRGNFWEGIDQVTEARANSSGRALPVASDVNFEGRTGCWRIGIQAFLSRGQEIMLELPYVADRGLILRRRPLCRCIRDEPAIAYDFGISVTLRKA